MTVETYKPALSNVANPSYSPVGDLAYDGGGGGTPTPVLVNWTTDLALDVETDGAVVIQFNTA